MCWTSRWQGSKIQTNLNKSCNKSQPFIKICGKNGNSTACLEIQQLVKNCTPYICVAYHADNDYHDNHQNLLTEILSICHDFVTCTYENVYKYTFTTDTQLWNINLININNRD